VISVMLPLKTVSEANTYQHWRVKAKRVREQRGLVRAALWARVYTLRTAMARNPAKRLAVLLTRYSLRNLDSDNLQSAFKACRDSVAECLGIDDGGERVTWEYAQARVPSGYAIRIAIEERP
jgi:hypothetical protein